jgi:hypothetical protein
MQSETKQNTFEEKLQQFASFQKVYMEMEYNEELDQAKRLIENSNLDELEEKGILISSLQLFNQLMSVFGLYELIFKRCKQKSLNYSKQSKVYL